MTLALRYAAYTDIGLGPKKRNEDSGYAGPYLLAIADGMGGAVGGDVASAITITTVRELDSPGHTDSEPVLGGAAVEANARIAARIETDPHLEGMGTTLTAVLFDGANAHVAHIGDSRAYLLRDGRLRMLTHDHTFVQTLVDEGRITPEEAEYHPHRSLIIRVLEGRQDARPDFIHIELDPGDRILVCSDGLDNAGVKDPLIAEILSRTPTPDEAAAALVEAALDHGSPDNVTCVVADIVDVGPDGPPLLGVGAGTLVGSAAMVDPEVTSGSGSITQSHPTASHDIVDDTADPASAMQGESGSDGLPPEPDMEEELRYAPRPPRRFKWLFRVVGLVVILGLLGVGARWAYDWTQRQYYVGAYPVDNSDASQPRRVAIFRGIAQQIPGIRVSQLYELEPLALAKLPPYHRERVASTITANDLGEARTIVAMLSDVARRCAPPPKPTPTPKPTGTPGSNRPTATATPGTTRPPTVPASRSPLPRQLAPTTRAAATPPAIPLECGATEPDAPNPTGTK